MHSSRRVFPDCYRRIARAVRGRRRVRPTLVPGDRDANPLEPSGAQLLAEAQLDRRFATCGARPTQGRRGTAHSRYGLVAPRRRPSGVALPCRSDECLWHGLDASVAIPFTAAAPLLVPADYAEIATLPRQSTESLRSVCSARTAARARSAPCSSDAARATSKATFTRLATICAPCLAVAVAYRQTPCVAPTGRTLHPQSWAVGTHGTLRHPCAHPKRSSSACGVVGSRLASLGVAANQRYMHMVACGRSA